MEKDALLKYLTNTLTPSLGSKAAKERAEKECAFVEKHQVQTFFIEDDNYPTLLRETADAPKLLYGKGNLSFDGHFLSIVGTRSASDRGKQLCRELVLSLAERVPDLTIVSGLAYGIDIAAHKAALEAGIPTIIIPAHGLDRIYPSLHRQVAIDALKNGGILTEYMSGTEPLQGHFLARNRIIAGLSEATVVVESKAKGGSLVTANIAFSYARDVFAFPGRVTDEHSAGCNSLIRRNVAGLITCADELIDALGWEIKPKPVQTSLNDLFAELSPEEETVMQTLRKYEDGVHINSLLTEIKMSYAHLAAMLFTLEMKGLVRALPGAMYRPC